jgi:hypothetical protein
MAVTGKKRDQGEQGRREQRDPALSVKSENHGSQHKPPNPQ